MSVASRVDDVLRAAAALLDPQRDAGRAAREAAVIECALSAPMADRVFDVASARYSRASVEALANDALAGRRVALVLAATVATAPLRAIALPWLAGADRIAVRPSRRQRRLVEACARAFERDAIVCVDAAPDGVDHVIAYGADDTLVAIESAIARGVSFEGRGHGFGVVYVREASDEAARAVALDVALHDQRGCLSPQAVFVRGDAVAFAGALHKALAAVERVLPRGRVAVGEAAAAMQWQGVMAARASWFRRGATHAVAAFDAPALDATPGLRNVVVSAVTGVDDVRAALGANARYVTCVGTDESAPVWGFTAARVVALGAMQDPPLDGPEDPRRPTRR